MAPSFIQIPSDTTNTGKKLQSWDNILNGSDVYSQSIVIVDSTGTEKATLVNPLYVSVVGATVTVQDIEAEEALALLASTVSGGAVTISGSISASNPSVNTNNTTAPTSSTQIGSIDGSGKLQAVSSTNPLPVAASFPSSLAVTQDTDPWVVSLTSGDITALTPPTASAIGSAVAGALTDPLPVALSSGNVATLTPPSAAAIAAAMAGLAVTNAGTFAVQDSTANGYLATLAGTVSAGAVNVSGSISASNPSVGTDNATGPTSSTQIGSQDGTGKLQAASTTNPLPVALPSGTVTTLTPPTAGAIGTAVATDLLLGTQLAGASVPVALPSATITSLTPPSASAIGIAVAAPSASAIASALTGLAVTASIAATQTIAVTQATASSLNATVVGSGTFDVAQTSLPSDLIVSGTIAANSANVTIATNGASEVVFNVTGTWSGTLQPQYQLADSSWVNGSVFPTLPSGATVSTISANGQWKTSVSGYKSFRILSTAWTSGTATINLEAALGQSFINTNIKGSSGVSLDAAPGAAAPTNAIQVGGTDGTDLRAILTSTIGQVHIIADTDNLSSIGGTAITAASASTAPTQLQPALVVGISPNNSGFPVNLPRVVQKASNSTGTAAETLSASLTGTTAGNALIVLVGLGLYAASNFTVAVSDGTNTYVQDEFEFESTTQATYAFRAPNIAGGNVTVAVTISGSSASNTGIAMAVYEVSGLSGGGLLSFEVASNSAAASGTSIVANVTPSNVNDIVFCAISSAHTQATITPTVKTTATWNLDYNLSPTGGGLGCFATLSTTVGEIGINVGNATAAMTTSAAYAAIWVVYKTPSISIAGQVNVENSISLQLNGVVADNNTAEYAFASGNANTLAVGTFAVTNSPASGSGWVGVRTPNVFNTVQVSSTGNTAVWSPSGKKFRLMRYQIELSQTATVTSGGLITISFQDATTAMNIAHDVWVPAAAGTVGGCPYVSPWFDLGNGYISTTSSNALNVNLSGALTTGTFRVNVCGTQE